MGGILSGGVILSYIYLYIPTIIIIIGPSSHVINENLEFKFANNGNAAYALENKL